MKCTNKDILLGLIGTLTDNECKDIYNFIIDREYKKEYLEFDLVKLTEEQYSKLIWLWGKDKTDKCIDILNEWLKVKNITKKISHYKQLNGWVERKYYQLYPPTDKSILNTNNIDCKWKAIKYIKRIPKELRAYDSEVKFLVNKYGKDILFC